MRKTLVLALLCLGLAQADPSFNEVRALGDKALARKDYTTAIREFERLVYLFGDRPDAYNALGFACYLDKRYERAILQFKQCLQFNPNHPAAQNNLMLAVGKRALEQTKELEFSEAIGLLASTEKQFPNHPQALVLRYSRGQLEFYRGNEEAGLRDWSVVAQRVPTSGTARFVEAHKLYSQGKLKQASEAMQIAQSKLPKEPVVLNYLALILADLGKTKEASALLRKAQQGNPPYVDLFINQAQMYLRQNDLDKAISEATKARDLRPDFASTHLWMSALLREKGDLEMSRKEMGIALAESSEAPLMVNGDLGKRVYLDGKPIGVSPLGAFAKPGRHSLKVGSQKLEVNLSPDQVTMINQGQSESQPATSLVPTQRAARSFALRDQSNHYWRSFQHFHQRPVVLLFWKVGDSSNAETLNGLSELGARYGTKIGCAVIHTDTEQKNQAISQMMSLPATYARLFDDNSSVTKRYGCESLPCVVVVGLDGYIAAQGTGLAGVEQARQALDSMVSP
jgi:tetratricopeptide (TPR) repeat protein